MKLTIFFFLFCFAFKGERKRSPHLPLVVVVRSSAREEVFHAKSIAGWRWVKWALTSRKYPARDHRKTWKFSLSAPALFLTRAEVRRCPINSIVMRDCCGIGDLDPAESHTSKQTMPAAVSERHPPFFAIFISPPRSIRLIIFRVYVMMKDLKTTATGEHPEAIKLGFIQHLIEICKAWFNAKGLALISSSRNNLQS